MVGAERRVREADASDARAVFGIRNAPANRPFFHHTEEIVWENHEPWFLKRYASGGPDRCHVLEIDGVVAGYCRLDVREDGSRLMSVALHPSFQRQGYGTAFIRDVLGRQPAGTVVRGEVLPTNAASLALFRKLGFADAAQADGSHVFTWTRRSAIAFGLKLWTGNVELFEEACTRYREGVFDFIELYFDPKHPFDAELRKRLSGIPIGIHAPHALDEFYFDEPGLALWERTKDVARVCGSETIVLHPGYERTIPDFAVFERELAKVDDPRILIENMPTRILTEDVPFGHDLETLARIRARKPICFDLEKATKAARFHEMDYLEYIRKGLESLTPNYFHISGGDVSSPQDQHRNLWEGTMDAGAISSILETYAARTDRVVKLVFETPKSGDGLSGDLQNMKYFRDASVNRAS